MLCSLGFLTAVPFHYPAAVQAISSRCAALFCHAARVLLLFLWRVCELDACFPEVLNSFSRGLLARPTFEIIFFGIV